MHRALLIQEILFNIFDHCRLLGTGIPSSDLLALARTCCAFKEPALDVLWGELVDPSPLARCLPGAHGSSLDMCYSFCRQLTQIEWGILRSYTRRVRSLLDEDDALDWESVRTFLSPPSTEPLLPNLRYLRATRSTENKHLFSMPLPSLVSLRAWLMPRDANTHVFRASLESISRFSPDIRTLSISLPRGDIPFNDFFSGFICRWQNLQTVDCPSIALGMDALAHLSRIPALTQLSFELSALLQNQIPPFDLPLFFSNLLTLTLYSDSLDPISQLLSRIRLSVITDFSSFVESCPSKHNVSTFLDSMQISNVHHTLRVLELIQMLGIYDETRDPKPVLCFEDLKPCMAFRDLCRIEVNVNWTVDLTDSKLLALVSTWPNLEHLLINKDYGWNTSGGITPNGLLQLLQTCPSLSWTALAMDTRGYTKLPSPLVGLGFTLRLKPYLMIDVVDSVIEAESVEAVGAFLAGIAPHPNFSFRAWTGFAMDTTVYQYRWFDAYRLAVGDVSQRS